MLQTALLVALVSCFQCVSAGDKVWLFAVGGNRRPANFIDTDGYIKGADIDLIKSVCSHAGKKCEVTVQPFEECVRSIRDRIYPGIGILSGWYDACTGYVSIPERTNSMKFTVPYAMSRATFAVAPGNPKNFDPNNISNSIIGTLNGLYTNSPCLKRLNKVPKGIVVAAELDIARNLLLNGTVDALFSPRTNIDRLEVLPGRYDCTVGGVGMMVRKDSELPDWWNPAFQSFYQSGNYTQWCRTQNQKYGGIPINVNEYCLPPKTSVSTGGVIGKK